MGPWWHGCVLWDFCFFSFRSSISKSWALWSCYTFQALELGNYQSFPTKGFVSLYYYVCLGSAIGWFCTCIFCESCYMLFSTVNKAYFLKRLKSLDFPLLILWRAGNENFWKVHGIIRRSNGEQRDTGAGGLSKMRSCSMSSWQGEWNN